MPEYDVVTAWGYTGKGLDTHPLPDSSRHKPEDLPQGLTVAVCTYQRAPSLERFLASLTTQERQPDELIIVDASPDEATEKIVKKFLTDTCILIPTKYFRVSGFLRGLTRQRNLALRWIDTDLVAFFDDDVVLSPGCLRVMERVHRSRSDSVVGVGAFIENQYRPPTAIWRVRRLLRMVSSLKPGAYDRSGMSIPWSFLPPTGELAEGDWLPGGATMWKTEIACELGFYEGFSGYAQGEDLDFSLRAIKKGKLFLATAARCQHLHESGGRPDDFKLGYMAIKNRYQIHRRCFNNQPWQNVAYFIYSWVLDTLFLSRDLLVPGRGSLSMLQMAGRFKASYDILLGK
jgi:GT2 family glycosyltransferase